MQKFEKAHPYKFIVIEIEICSEW